jgi:hypothetical protein
MKRSALAIVIALILASPLYAAESQKEKEFNELKARATAVSKRLASADAAESRKATAEWQKLFSDFNAWATRHNVATKSQTEPRAASGTGTGLHACPPYMEGGPCYFCVLDMSRSTPTKCVYRCYRYC